MPGADRTNRQRRCLPVEYSTREEGGELYIEGYFAVFNSPYEFWPGHRKLSCPVLLTNLCPVTCARW